MESREIAIEKTKLLSFTYVLPAVAFAIPLLVSGPQILTGTLVNSFLFLVVQRKFSRRYFMMVAILPSIGAITHGVLFGPFTPFLLYFLPFIWLGNLTLIMAFCLLEKPFEKPIAILTSSLLKSLFLYAFAFLFVNLRIVPKIFLTSMGIIQFLTAILGGILAISISRFLPSFHGR
ncbi:hypothetical protein COT62_03240 [Candidatus Roizmanbacteria bacterium CG09_land_8_20_14_0_10_41_9]|uniref:Uncharacterized protein n=1 Tax=Candidatus Roizmanbacteria bacterium CG09_land_8_20_14_0_10_41_9 TaxID=1974850 RepID=A0A2H0WUA2_9BACT|nr:MAG: hypothetical protein COT62_03240 [Candidatus Roizmanbacteria bacterium CG09_land_8_20_14_0_10_41_9]